MYMYNAMATIKTYEHIELLIYTIYTCTDLDLSTSVAIYYEYLIVTDKGMTGLNTSTNWLLI